MDKQWQNYVPDWFLFNLKIFILFLKLCAYADFCAWPTDCACGLPVVTNPRQCFLLLTLSVSNSSAVRGAPLEFLNHLWQADARFPFLSYTTCLSVCLPILRTSVYISQHECGGQRTACRSWFSSSTMRVAGIELRQAVLGGQAPLPTKVILPVPLDGLTHQVRWT